MLSTELRCRRGNFQWHARYFIFDSWKTYSKFRQFQPEIKPIKCPQVSVVRPARETPGQRRREKQHSTQRTPVCVIQKSMSVYRLCTLRCEQFEGSGRSERAHNNAGHQESTLVKLSQQLFAWSDAERKLDQKQFVKSSYGSMALLHSFGKHIQVISRIHICRL